MSGQRLSADSGSSRWTIAHSNESNQAVTPARVRGGAAAGSFRGAHVGLSIPFCGLFLVSWIAQGFAEWGTYRAEQQAHDEPVTISGYAIAFGRSTRENWQSEFLQLFSFVVLSSLLIHRESAGSKDSDDRMVLKIDAIRKRLDERESVQSAS